MSFQEVQFPSNIRYSSSGGPMYSTDVVVLKSGHEQRNGNWSYPRHQYVINALKNGADIQTVLDFFHAMNGRLHGFRFKDWADFTSNDGQSAVTSLDQVMIPDPLGSLKVFYTAKNYTIGSETLVRPITKLVTGSFAGVSVNGGAPVSVTAVNYNTGRVELTSTPPGGAVITSGFEFDVPVRFDTDTLELEQAFFETVTMSIPIVELRT